MPLNIKTTGIEVLGLQETQELLLDKASIEIPDIDLSVNSPLRWILSYVGELEYNNSLALQSAIYQSSARTANGIYLDKILISRNTARISAQKGVVQCICYGNDNTTIPALTQVKKTDGTLFQNISQGTITKSNAVFISLDIGAVGVGTIYSITINGENITYTALGTESIDDIITNLIGLIQSNVITNALVNASNVNSRLEILSISSQVFISYDVSTSLTIFQVGSPVLFTAVDDGTFTIPIGTITQIVNTVIGFTKINNLISGLQGSLSETNSAARERYYKSGIYANATCTPLGIRNAILKLTTARTCKIIDNKTDFEVNGRPPHSVTIVVEGGEDEDIAKVLSSEIGNSGVASGIVTDGNTTITYTDEQFNETYTYKIERPTEVYIHIELTIPDQVNGEYSYTNTPIKQEAIKSFLTSYMSSNFGIGKDIKKNDIISAITFSSVGLGIALIGVRMAKTINPLDIPTFADILILEIDEFEKSSFATDRVIMIS